MRKTWPRKEKPKPVVVYDQPEPVIGGAGEEKPEKKKPIRRKKKKTK